MKIFGSGPEPELTELEKSSGPEPEPEPLLTTFYYNIKPQYAFTLQLI